MAHRLLPILIPSLLKLSLMSVRNVRSETVVQEKLIDKRKNELLFCLGKKQCYRKEFSDQ